MVLVSHCGSLIGRSAPSTRRTLARSSSRVIGAARSAEGSSSLVETMYTPRGAFLSSMASGPSE